MARSHYIAILIKSFKGLELVSSLPHWAKNMLQMLAIQHSSIWPNFILIGFKTTKHKCNFHYVAIPITTSEILKSVDFTKTHKSRYLENETFFFQMKKKMINLHIKGYLTAKIIL